LNRSSYIALLHRWQTVDTCGVSPP
jgi:hypothetical protein